MLLSHPLGHAPEVFSLLSCLLLHGASDVINLIPLLLCKTFHETIQLFLMAGFASTCLHIPLGFALGTVTLSWLVCLCLWLLRFHVFVVLIPSTDSDSNEENELGCIVPDVKLFSLRLPCLVVGHHCHDTFASQHDHLVFSSICCSL